ncbi:uncharacterized protein LOC132737823 [Ruditapes philippinarum]|uniref:uncharacterized protein LOC132737823 n=1 Tax=Ruditapes philippinarum TaxID=129788 RepID=UPI00295A8363|nr:uncharacterized protein LOC132737823 [Ruditapes philippinarum]
MTLRWIKPERYIGDTIVEFDACSFSTLSVTGANEGNFELSPNDESTSGEDEETSEEYGSSFLSVKEANSDNTENTVRGRDQETVTIYERKPTLTQSDIDNEILCEFCVEIKATHFCKLCKGDGMRMCHRCLRCHARLTNHQSDVMSLLSNTESLNLVHGCKERRSHERPPDKVVDRQPSPPVLKLSKYCSR